MRGVWEDTWWGLDNRIPKAVGAVEGFAFQRYYWLPWASRWGRGGREVAGGPGKRGWVRRAVAAQRGVHQDGQRVGSDWIQKQRG